jgi:hypothetical protein
MYYPQHTPAHKAAADMKELGVKLVSECSGASVSQLEAAAAQAQAPACAAQPGSASVPDMPSLPHMSAIASDWFAQSLVSSFFPTNSLHFPNPEASIFSLLMSPPVRPRPLPLSRPVPFSPNFVTRRRTSACFPLRRQLLQPRRPWERAR